MSQERNLPHSSYRQFPQPPLPTQYPPTQAVPATQQLFGQVPHLCVQDSQSMPPPPRFGILAPPTGLQTYFPRASSVMEFVPQGHIEDFARRQYGEWPSRTGYLPLQNGQVPGQQSSKMVSGQPEGPTLKPSDYFERARYATVPIPQTLAPKQGSGQNVIVGPVAEPNSYSRSPDNSRKVDDVLPHFDGSSDQMTPSSTKRKTRSGAINHKKAKRSKSKGTAGIANKSKHASAHAQAHTGLHEPPRPNKKVQDQRFMLASLPQSHSEVNTSLSIAPDFAEFLDDNGKPWIDTLMQTALSNQESPTVHSSGKRELSPGWNALIAARRDDVQSGVGIATCQTRGSPRPHLKRRQPQPSAVPSIQAPSKEVIEQNRPPATQPIPYISPYPPVLPTQVQVSAKTSHDGEDVRSHARSKADSPVQTEASSSQPKPPTNLDYFDFGRN